MNTLEHIVTVVGEEMGEVVQVTQAITKAALQGLQHCQKGCRFGMLDVNPATGATNLAEMVKEANDFLGALLMLRDLLEARGIKMEGLFDPLAAEAKQHRVATWMEHAIKVGALTPVEVPMTVPPEQRSDDLSGEERRALRRLAEDACHAANSNYGPFVTAVSHPLNILSLLDMADRAVMPRNVATMERELAAWRERFTQHTYSAQDECVALRQDGNS